MSSSPSEKPRRLASLDAFRGLTMLGMLLVNNIALDVATPRQLVHAAWNAGLTFADMVFPWFLFITGVAIPYSAASSRRRQESLFRYDLKVLGRALSLVALGCLIDSSIARYPIFDLGVLQLIGLAYLVAALLYELPTQRRLFLAAGLLVIHWALIRFLPIPGIGSGIFTEETNAISHLNATYLRPLHLAGLLSVVPTAALVLLGTTAGDILRRADKSGWQQVGQLLSLGIVIGLIGWLWSLDLPFNKPLWTTPYVLFASGIAFLVLGLLYLVIDVQGWRWWAWPLIVLGMNAIFIYVVPILVKIYILSTWQWKLPDGSHLTLGVYFMHVWFEALGRVAGGWAYTISYIVFWWLIAVWMYFKKIFLRV